MNHNKIFFGARLHLAGWYAGVMGIILTLSGVGIYQVMAHAHWQAVDRELESVAGTLHDSLEPLLQQSDRIDPSRRFLLALLADDAKVRKNLLYARIDAIALLQ